MCGFIRASLTALVIVLAAFPSRSIFRGGLEAVSMRAKVILIALVMLFATATTTVVSGETVTNPSEPIEGAENCGVHVPVLLGEGYHRNLAFKDGHQFAWFQHSFPADATEAWIWPSTDLMSIEIGRVDVTFDCGTYDTECDPGIAGCLLQFGGVEDTRHRYIAVYRGSLDTTGTFGIYFPTSDFRFCDGAEHIPAPLTRLTDRGFGDTHFDYPEHWYTYRPQTDPPTSIVEVTARDGPIYLTVWTGGWGDCPEQVTCSVTINALETKKCNLPADFVWIEINSGLRPTVWALPETHLYSITFT